METHLLYVQCIGIMNGPPMHCTVEVCVLWCPAVYCVAKKVISVGKKYLRWMGYQMLTQRNRSLNFKWAQNGPNKGVDLLQRLYLEGWRNWLVDCTCRQYTKKWNTVPGLADWPFKNNRKTKKHSFIQHAALNADSSVISICAVYLRVSIRH